MTTISLLLSAVFGAGAAVLGFCFGRWWLDSRYVVLQRSTHVAFLAALNQRTRELDQLRSESAVRNAEPLSSVPPFRLWKSESLSEVR